MSKRPESSDRSPEQNPSKRRPTGWQSTPAPPQRPVFGVGAAPSGLPMGPAAQAPVNLSATSVPVTDSPETSEPAARGIHGLTRSAVIHDLLTKKNIITAATTISTENHGRYATRLASQSVIWNPPNLIPPPFGREIAVLRGILDAMRSHRFFQPPPLLTDLDDDELRIVLGLNPAFASSVSDVLRAYAENLDDLHPTVVVLLSYLCYAPEGDTVRASAPAQEENDVAEVLEAWDAPLKGAAHVSILQALRNAHVENANKYPNQHYTNNVTMLQSSGTGKSRYVKEMSKLILLVVLILRDALDRTGFPKADVAVRDFLVVLPGAKVSEQQYRERVRLFLLVTFLSVHAWLRPQTPPPPPEESIDLKHWDYLYKVNAWNMFLTKNRTEAYAAIVRTVEQIVHPVQNSAAAMAAALENLVSFLKGSTVASGGDGSLVPPIFLTARLLPGELEVVLVETKAAYKAAVDSKLRCPDFSDESPELLVLLSFDESHGLTESALGEGEGFDSDTSAPSLRPKSAYDVVLGVLNDVRPHVAGLFLSTSTKIGQFAPPAALAPSARQVTSKRLQAPITEMPFDCYLGRKVLRVGSDDLTLKNLSSVSFMARFGRPLYGSRLVTENAKKLSVQERAHREKRLLELVRQKLAGGSEPPTITSHLDRAAIAALDVRIRIEYEPRKSSVIDSTQSDMVATNLRWAISVPDHRLYFHSMYPSEPINAEAAAVLMRTWMSAPSPWSPVNTLVEMMNQGTIDLGERGELTARLLLTLAYDRAMANENPGTPAVWMFSKGCRFLGFIGALFGPENAASLEKSPPDNISEGLREPLSTAFEHSLVRFTHFVKLGDRSGLKTTALCAAFIRGMAYIGSVNQARVDLIIPVLVDSTLAVPVCPANMSAILIQVKRRLAPGSDSSYDYTAEELGLFSDSDDGNELVSQVDRRTRPYCTLLMELATYQPVKDRPPATPTKKRKTAEPKAAATPSGLTIKQPAERESARIKELKLKKDPTQPHPRYKIKAYGCSHSVYGVIDPDDHGLAGKTKYSQLLGTRDFTDEHPRKELLPLVRAVKPTWVSNEDTNSYEWFDATVSIEPEDFEDESQDRVLAPGYGQEE